MISNRTHKRGSVGNPRNRFEAQELVPDDCELECGDELGAVRTRFYADQSRSVIARNASPDVGFEASVNPYRGCEHGCSYCYARPTHEYLGFSPGLDFESRIMVKLDAAALLRDELCKRSWEPQVLAMSGVTDPYQPAERRFRITRQCLEVLAEFRNPVAIVTKNALVTRDIDVLSSLARVDAVCVYISVTTLDLPLNRAMEPRTSTPAQRLAAIRELGEAGVPVGVMVAPIIPGLNEHEIPEILSRAGEAGARFAGRVMLRLPYAVKDIFESWLERHVPDRKERVLNRIREMRGGKLNTTEFGARMTGEGRFAEHIVSMFRVAARKAGIRSDGPVLSTAQFRRPGPEQLELV